MGVDPRDQAYICPHCGVRFVGYRALIQEPPAPAIIANLPTQPRQPPRICCSPGCYAMEVQSHAAMCENYWQRHSYQKQEQKALEAMDQDDGWAK